jgi:hypothetical protein
MFKPVSAFLTDLKQNCKNMNHGQSTSKNIKGEEKR